jgi:pimeloyl-ACP methyl ester carboxylesterase
VLVGWEQGLLDFAAAQRMHHRRQQPRNQITRQALPLAFDEKMDDSVDDDDVDDDGALLERVLNRPNTRVAVVLGGKDRVVPMSRILSFFRNYPTVDCAVMEGLGHDPFEENVNAFVSLVEEILCRGTRSHCTC